MPLLTFTLPLYSLLLFSSTTTAAAQPYNATDHYLFDCGSSSTTNFSDRIWDGDESSNFVPSSITTTSFSSAPLYRDPSVPETPYSTARIFNTSSFTYKFPVSQGPKFVRLYFYPTTYSDLNPNQSYFSVSCNGYSLLSNFSAFRTASFLATTRSDAGVDGPQVPNFVKEFIIYVKDTRILNVTFTPTPNSYAFINGIEIVSMPENLYFNSSNLNYVGQTTGPVIDNKKALENIYRLNMGGGHISGTEDTGMYRSWEQDNRYIYGAAIGWTPVYAQLKPITYTLETPNYTAPELVYQTQRSMGNQADRYNLTWLLSVDSGFYYKLRLHFCNIIPQYTERGQVVFKIFINNQTADEEIDLFHLTQDSGYPVYKDYIVFVNDPDRSGGKQDMWVAIHPSPNTETFHDAYLNGLEAFKVSADRSLASPNPELREYPQPRPASPVIQNKKKTVPYGPIIGGVGGGLVLLTVLSLVVFLRTRVKHFGKAGDKPTKSTKTCQPPLLSDRCLRFSLIELKIATCEFDEKCIIGKGGFGTVYKGYIDNTKTVIAIKRLKSSSKQGFHEFRTEIGFLSKLRHVQLVSLIGYCDDEGEMILVYDYMPNGTLREHLYKNNNPPLSWKRRLDICIGSAKGLQYLHTGANRAIIHRDVKSTNILLDENWVAKLSDFGLSKLGPKDRTKDHVSTVGKGTIGYMDPEYYRRRQLTEKSDVYSFGVVLLEVLCARPVINLGLPDKQVNLAELGKSCYRKGTLHEIIDLNLSGEIAPRCLMKFGETAISCLKHEGIARPTMDEVIWGLELALQLQEDAEETGGMLENQQLSLSMQAEPATTDEYVSLDSTGMAKRHDTSPTDTFSEISQSTAG
ncbi:putative protein kinase RLK-Pelle-CrRLK1L-1 family [Helianthus annuus]|uniref:Putative serine/threonine/dual specificity protein kinase, catalytic domain-containing protein n=1 Tax=Helianthus annuus TaxID=4232 RepID=A0A251VJB6_HELAN|nr:receptor-like protein kinase FERONIA [Helianthus annuus]KAF5791931.1 putative protein kinase RLK-Pelle-CrRLK1L-1 family [Helianthus annuus]KAJ0535501.1 putative protein kinase RLK-Pelle-CrRLK1L-1 family [Helianthus annuus]KAJ0708386.1 putative protein kinase RLK-Pelle-CrRLK1L-1 family [Helianthus annuus]KAJ0889377.1 putative protein kinase RLK-Pelle-CrRLK1L-1 family [Helianthus annuus]KAJ0894176.1 putative protein kinase RLK-Pelle-CrRLK1L-1 family [Helianthus annuus]